MTDPSEEASYIEKLYKYDEKLKSATNESQDYQGVIGAAKFPGLMGKNIARSGKSGNSVQCVADVVVPQIVDAHKNSVFTGIMGVVDEDFYEKGDHFD